MTAPKHPQARPQRRDPRPLPSAWLSVSHLLLTLAAILLLVMPFTEHLWAGDRFLRGGQDVELTLFAILAFLCMVIVISEVCRLALQRLLTLRLYKRLTRRQSIVSQAIHTAASALPQSPRLTCSLPLQI